MTKIEGKSASAAVKDILLEEPDVVRELMRVALEVLEAEMDETLGAAKGRAHERAGWLPLRLLRPHADHPRRQAGTQGAQDRAGRFSTELFERYQRSERALVATLAEMGACPRA